MVEHVFHNKGPLGLSMEAICVSFQTAPGYTQTFWCCVVTGEPPVPKVGAYLRPYLGPLSKALSTPLI